MKTLLLAALSVGQKPGVPDDFRRYEGTIHGVPVGLRGGGEWPADIAAGYERIMLRDIQERVHATPWHAERYKDKEFLKYRQMYPKRPLARFLRVGPHP